MNPMKPFFLSFFSFLFIISIHAQGYDPAKVNKKAAALYSQAIEKAESGSYLEAIGLMDQALKQDKKFVDAYLSKAGLYGELKNYPMAIENYETAFKLDPEYSRDYKLPYAINLAGKGEFEKALAGIDEFTKDPSLNESSLKAAAYRRKCFAFGQEME